MEMLRKILSRSGPGVTSSRIRRRRALVSLISRRLPYIRAGLFVVGYLWMAALPLPWLGWGTYIDENALQPGQVNTYWSWGDVQRADRYLEMLESLQLAGVSSEHRASVISTEFSRLGIPSATQNYSFYTNTGVMSGANAYAFFSSPRTPGTEAMVISASWYSRSGDGHLIFNLRGVSTVLALVASLKRQSLWAKDLIFVMSDGYLDGMHAFLSAYHGVSQSNLRADPLELASGVIWTALNIDYPGHSFSHLGVFFEGLNGRLPNQDLINSFRHISMHTGGVPVVLYDHHDPNEGFAGSAAYQFLPSWVPNIVADRVEVKQYVYRATNILRHAGFQARGRPSGVHGLFHQFRIDAITLFAVPAIGPHGFHAIGRIIESTLRTTNNLLERLHASLFFYIMTTPDKFIKIGGFLPSAVLISVAMMFGGLRLWVDAGWVVDKERVHIKGKGEDSQPSESPIWHRRQRPTLMIVCIMMCTHIAGLLLFFIVTRSWFIDKWTTMAPLVFAIAAGVPLTGFFVSPTVATKVAPPSLLLNALNLCFASTVISVTTVLNFSLAAMLAVLLGLPLSLAYRPHRIETRLFKYACYVVLAVGWMVMAPGEARRAIWDWDVLRGSFAPFICIVYVPLVMQAGIVSLLP